MDHAYDYVIIGGGSAGCACAGELAADPDVSVLLLECGDAADDNPETLQADGYKDAFVNDRVIWTRFSEPQAGCGGRHLFMGSGRGMGGSGSVNAMVYLRGDARDFAAWNTRGWAWSDVRPHFESLERTLDVRRREPTAFTETCIMAAESAGFSRKEDLNDGDLSGFLGYEWMNYREKQRRSSYVAFVRDQPRANLAVRAQVRVHRVVFDADRRACAVDFVDAAGRPGRVAVRREVVLAAGALETPRLLMLSGVGPGEHLRSHGIDVVWEAPEIGRNLQDHPNVTLFFAGRGEVDAHYPQLYGFQRADPYSALPAGMADTCYVFYPARSSLREAMMRMLPAITLPPRMHERPALPRAMRRAVDLAFRVPGVTAAVRHVFGIVVILGKPHSRGRVELASARPEDAGRIDPAYFSDPRDMQTIVHGIRLARRMGASPALQRWGAHELFPSPLARTHSALEGWVRANAMTTYHYGGTCRLGDDPRAPVDGRLRLRGVSGVRVADASAIPVVPVSALNAPSMLMGLRAARFMREDFVGPLH